MPLALAIQVTAGVDVAVDGDLGHQIQGLDGRPTTLKVARGTNQSITWTFASTSGSRKVTPCTEADILELDVGEARTEAHADAQLGHDLIADARHQERQPERCARSGARGWPVSVPDFGNRKALVGARDSPLTIVSSPNLSLPTPAGVKMPTPKPMPLSKTTWRSRDCRSERPWSGCTPC